MNKHKFVDKLECPDIDLSKLSRNQLKDKINNHFTSQYND